MKVVERAKDFNLYDAEMPTIHGKVDITLKNVKTGLVDRIHGENAFQSAVLASYMRGLGEVDNSPFASGGFNSRTAWQNLVGGILLFRDTIEVGNKYMPAGNSMTGQGSFETSNGSSADDPNEMGSWSAGKSGASRTAIQQVYEFTTDQANGQISCVSLTSRMGGLIGYGNASDKTKGNYDMATDQSSRIISNIRSVYYNGEIWSVDGIESGVLTFNARKSSLLVGSVFNGYSRKVSFDLSEVGNPYNIQTGYGFWLVDCGGGIIRFVIAHSRGTDYNNPKVVSAGQPLYYYEFNANNETLVLKQITNPTNTSICNSHASWNYDYWNCIVNDKYYIGKGAESSTYNLWYIIDLTTGTLVNTFDMENSTTYGMNVPRKISNGLYLFGHYSNAKSHIFDSASNSFKLIGVYPDSCGFLSEQLDALVTGGFYKNPLYLATIYNLQSPVQKTPAQTMEVSYTLTEV